MSTSTIGQFTPSPNYEHDRSMPSLDIQDLFHEVVADCYHELEARSIYFPLKGTAREKYGDYAFYGVIDICDRLRKKDPHLFYKKGPRDIAKKIKKVFESRDFPMIKRLSLHDAGILTFSLEGRWIAKRIMQMLKDGIDAWAPTIFAAGIRGKTVFVFPTNPGIGSDIVRAIYMKDALVNLYLYSGVDVGSGFCDERAWRKAHEHFTEIRGKIVSVNHQTSLNGRSHDVYIDLGTLWYGANIQKANIMVYMTPHRLRGYIEQCHIAAANEGWLPDDYLQGLGLTCCGFRTFSGEKQELCDLWERFCYDWPKFKNLGNNSGYTCGTFFECVFKFTCLKRHRLAACIFKIEDLIEDRLGGNTFPSLLRTKALAHSIINNNPDRSLYKLNVLAGKERELGLHFVEFTKVVYSACGGFVPHVLCEYLSDLSKLFNCCYREIWQVSPENMLGLCEATIVVMSKCFQLLGIAPSIYEWSMEFKTFLDREEARATKLHIIPSSEDARVEHSRFEIFSMYVEVAHSHFKVGNVTGKVTFVDKCRLADGHGWVRVDKNDDCHVSYFDREWYDDAVTIDNGAYIPLGNTSSVRSVPFSASIEVALLIKATSKERDQTYLIYNGCGSADMTKFWDGDSNTKCGTIKVNREDGHILLNFVAIKKAVDTTMELWFYPVKDIRLCGKITASYGKEILRDSGFLGEYNAHIFRADPPLSISCGKPYLLTLHKSALAVPANGRLRMQADLVDFDTKQQIVDEEVDLRESGSCDGVSYWKIRCNEGTFELSVKWVH